MKVVKFLMKTILWIVAIVLVVILAIPLWIGPVVCGVANRVAPGITKTDFHLGTFKLNPYTGRLVVGDLQLGNPTNFSEKNAVDLTQLEVKVDVASLFGKKIRVELVDVGALQVYAAFPKADNFLQIAKNAQGEDKAKADGEGQEAAKAEVEAEVEKANANAKAEGEVAKDEKEQGKGLQIDKLSIHDVTIKYGIAPIPFGLTLTDIGADKEEGASPMEVFKEIENAVMKALAGAAGALGDLGKGVLEMGGKGLKSIGDGATSAVSGTASQATDAVSESASKATKAAGEAAGKAVDALKKLW